MKSAAAPHTVVSSQVREFAGVPKTSIGDAAALRACWLGRMSYRAAYAIQRRLLEQVIAGGPEALLLLEHAPVVTVGRSCPRGEARRLRELLGGRLDVAEAERGGHLTYHGPGQLVAYPIVRLDRVGRDLHRWLDVLEDAAVGALAHFGVRAEPGRRERRGVWVSGRKIGSVGVAVRRWVSFHGVAINVRRDWRPPVRLPLCQMPPDAYTSLEEQGVAVELRALADVFAHELSRLCGFCGLTWHDLEDLVE